MLTLHDSLVLRQCTSYSAATWVFAGVFNRMKRLIFQFTRPYCIVKFLQTPTSHIVVLGVRH